MGAIYKRELKSYFSSMIGATFLAVFFLFSGLYFYFVIDMGDASLYMVFGNMFIFVIMLIPLLTMRLMSDDKRQKTDQLLLTSRTSLTRIVLGKFFAALTIYAIAISVNIVYGLVMTMFGNPDWLSILANLFGELLLGATFIAIGLLISTLTESQVIAAVSTFALFIFILLLDSLSTIVEWDFVEKFVNWISVNRRYNEFANGVIDFSSVFFFVSAAATMLFLTVRVLDKRRWN